MSQRANAMTNSQPPKSEKSFSEVLLEIAGNIPPEGLTLRNILEKVGSQGLLPLCMILTIPFLLPVSLPGSSLPFGFLMALIGFGRLFDRPPWLPARFLNRRLTAAQAGTLLGKGSRFFARLEKYIHPRLYFLTHADTTGRVNSVALIVTAICLTAPLPLPFTNTFPAYGVLFLSSGMLERDGALLVLGYCMLTLTLAYFTFIWIFGVTGLQALALQISLHQFPAK